MKRYIPLILTAGLVASCQPDLTDDNYYFRKQDSLVDAGPTDSTIRPSLDSSQNNQNHRDAFITFMDAHLTSQDNGIDSHFRNDLGLSDGPIDLPRGTDDLSTDSTQNNHDGPIPPPDGSIRDSSIELPDSTNDIFLPNDIVVLNDASTPDSSELTDALVQPDFRSLDASCATTFYLDQDNDGSGDPNTILLSCIQPDGYVQNNDDCAPNDPERYQMLQGFADIDRDTFTQETPELVCSGLTLYQTHRIERSGQIDCNDLERLIHPQAEEQCNRRDDNCNFRTDEGLLCGIIAYALSVRPAPDGPSNFEIAVIPAGGGVPTNITNHPSADEEPSFCPDGTIVFLSNRDSPLGEIYKIDQQGNNLQRLTNNEQREANPVCGMDNLIVFAMQQLDTSYDLYSVHADNLEQLTDTPAIQEVGPAISPDGVTILFYSDRQEGNFDIYEMTLANHTIIQKIQTPDHDHTPAYSPDQSTIAFAREEQGNNNIWIQDREGNQLRLTEQGTQEYRPRFSPNGEYITFYTRGEGQNKIYRVNNNGQNQVLIHQSDEAEQFPDWF